MKNIILMLCLAWLVLTSASAQQQTFYPKREFRGAWIQAVNGQFRGKSTAEVKRMLTRDLNALQEAGINAVIFQVRPEADALYASRLEPWSRYLTGVQGQAPNPYWDPMQFMIDECHKRGMELHAWINPYRAKTTMRNELSPKSVVSQHPEWFVQYGDQLFFNPALEESRRWICRVVTDIVNQYDVDAIHMDDYFYPYPIQGKDFPDDDDYARLGAGFSNKGDWRRNNVNLLIRDVQQTIKRLKPWVKFGVSPFGIYRNDRSDPLGSRTNGLQNYDDLYADVVLWAHNGWIDYNIPQVYWHVGHPVADYETLVKWWALNSENRPLFIGQSILNTVQNKDPRNANQDQMDLKFRLQRGYQSIQGSCQWYTQNITEDVSGYASRLKNNYHKYPALQPVFSFIDHKGPRKVRKMAPVWTADGYILFWTEPKYKNEMDRPVRYVVYSFAEGETVDLEDPTRIVAITTDCYYKLPYESGQTKRCYVVTALDRLSNESKPVRKIVKL